MNINNTWQNNEDALFLLLGCTLNLKKESYLMTIYEINKLFHVLTDKYKLLMTLSPDYCDFYSIDYINDYFTFLERNKNNYKLFPTEGYEFYKQGTSRVSKICYKNEAGKIVASYVHALTNDLNGNAKVFINDSSTRNDSSINKQFYDTSPLFVGPTYIIENPNQDDTICVNFSIQSHCSIWLDITPNFKYYENNRLQVIAFANNKEIAFYNTPRLNSFFRDIREIVAQYGGDSRLYDYKSLLDVNNKNRISDAEKRKGLLIDKKVVFQEDMDAFL